MGHFQTVAGHKTEETGQNEAGHPRARTPSSGGMSRLSHGTQEHGTGTVVVGQGQSSASLRDRPHPTDTPEVRREKERLRLSADPRFAGWAARVAR